MPSLVQFGWCLIIAIVFSAVVLAYPVTLRSFPQHLLSSPLKARLTLEEVLIPRQQNLREYERLLLESMPSSSTVIRWYIASFRNESAVIEAVVEKSVPSSVPVDGIL